MVVGSQAGDRSYSAYVNGTQVGEAVSAVGVAYVRREGGGGAVLGAEVATLARAGAASLTDFGQALAVRSDGGVVAVGAAMCLGPGRCTCTETRGWAEAV